MGSEGFALIVIVAILVGYGSTTGARSVSEHEEGETLDQLSRQLDVLNKPPIKSFKTDYGTIDCVDMYKQPAFDNPLLKDHNIQIIPSHLPPNTQIKTPLRSGYHRLGGADTFPGCPGGTVPIRRVTREDLIRDRSSNQLQEYDPFISKDPNTLYAVVKLGKGSPSPFVAAKASVNVRNPKVGDGDSSGAQMWLYGGDGGSANNFISAGWLVDPQLYGDHRTYFTAYWKGDGSAGCVNVRCPGFVQTDPNAPLGFLLPNISSNEDLWDIPIHIYQDQQTKNWWLAGGDNLTPVGYWPKELFSRLKDGANSLALGGFVKRVPGQPAPQMGSAIVDCNFDFSAYFANIEFKLSTGDFVTPNWDASTDQVDCTSGYKVMRPCDDTKHFEFAFFYGGNGKRC